MPHKQQMDVRKSIMFSRPFFGAGRLKLNPLGDACHRTGLCSCCNFGVLQDLLHKTTNLMIKEVSGDILLSQAQAIAHGVAPNDHFDRGLALNLREEFPAMYKDFRHYCQQYHPKPGGAWIWSGVGHRIINLFTQEPPETNNSHPGKASVKNVNNALKELAKMITDEGLKSVAIPRLATGVGGLDWEEVRPLIYNILDPLPIPVYVYKTYTKGFKVVEE